MTNETTTPAPDRSSPPAGYTECSQKCGRWTGTEGSCWACIVAIDDSEYAKRSMATSKYPDWSPPLPAAPVHVAREAGQVEQEVACLSIPLTQKKTAFVDEEDSDLLEHKWRASDNRGVWYARRWSEGSCSKRKLIYLHREVAARTGLAIDGMHVDHIDGDGLNCRRSNLRVATHAQNQHNQGLRVTNKSGFKGVHFNKKTGRYVATIRAGGRRFILGYYESAEDAGHSYAEAARKYHGEFANVTMTLLSAPKAEAAKYTCVCPAEPCFCRASEPSKPASQSQCAPCGQWFASAALVEAHMASCASKPTACRSYQRRDEWPECYVCDMPESAHKPAAAEKGPACDCARDTHSGPVLLRHLPPQAKGAPHGTLACEECYLWWESRINADGLTNVLDNPAIPERLARPRLAHSSQWADEAEDA